MEKTISVEAAGPGTATSTDATERDAADERRMSFWEHIEELRQRGKRVLLVVIVLFALFLVTAVGSVAIAGTQVPMLVPALGTNQPNVATQFFLWIKDTFVPDRVAGVNVSFAFQNPWDAYIVMFKVAFFLAIVTGSPFIAYETWAFIGPALRPSEKRLILRITVPVAVLFLAGVALCFLVVLPFTIALLFSAQNIMGANLYLFFGDTFLDFVLLFAVAFGLAFQLPVVMYGLSALGIVGADFWRRYWRFAAIGIFFFGAIITPDGSGVTMMLVSLPMLVLYILGYFSAKRVERRRMRAKSS